MTRQNQLKPDREINGVPVVGRPTIAETAGKSRKTIDTAAGKDPEFPAPYPEHRVDRAWWYPLDTAQTYINLIATRDEARKPPPVDPTGDPNELLDATAVAAEINVKPATIRHYVRLSLPYWNEENGRDPHAGQLPPPDDEEPADINGTHRYWYRHTIAQHQAGRPGYGTRGGRPKKSTPQRPQG